VLSDVSGGTTLLGEEAHVVARSVRGPRGRRLPRGEIDGYDNLVLLCPNHHRAIDERDDLYPEATVRELKRLHETWVAVTLSAAAPTPALVSLPGVPPRMVNRLAELDALNAAKGRAVGAPRSSVVLLTGMRGVGKSTLGSHWVARNGADFDASVTVDLSCHRRDGVVDVSDAVAGLLRALGVWADAIPATLSERRQMLADVSVTRRLLVLLDDVDHPAQVQSLLPAGPGSLMVVTSAFGLEELVFEGADVVSVDPFDVEAAAALMGDIVGEGRVRSDVAAVGELVDMCGGLPLALRVCGARLAGRGRAMSVADMVESLRGAPNRVAALSGNGQFDVGAVLDGAYQDLGDDLRAVYRAAASVPSPTWTVGVLAAAAGVDLGAAHDGVAKLCDASLLVAGGDGRFGFHELVGLHARGVALEVDGRVRCDAAKRRVVEWYRAALWLADVAAAGSRLRLHTGPVDAPVGFDVPMSTRSAFEWFASERESIAAVVAAAAAERWDELSWGLAEPLWPFVYNRRDADLWVAAFAAAVPATVRLGDHGGEARSRSCLARALLERGDSEQSAAELSWARDAAARSGNVVLCASVEEFTGIDAFERGQITDALDRFRVARVWSETVGNARGVAIQDYQIGKCLLASGETEEALDALHSARVVFEQLGDGVLESRVRRREAEALETVERWSEASVAVDEAIRVARELDQPFDEASASEVAARIASHEDPSKVAAFLADAFRSYRRIGHPRAQVLLGSVQMSELS
jgi:tetratricopeptide (TPR) repeat protein